MSKKTTQNLSTLNTLLMELDIAQTNAAKAHQALDTFNALPENNVYPTIKDALTDIGIDLLNKAEVDCEGSYNYGANEYTQLFMVDSKTYLATLTVEYSRHDRRYYYVDDSELSYEPV
jgi:hypothetical protein